MKDINSKQLKLRTATPDDAPFIAWAISTALHEEESSEEIANLVCDICRREDTLYSWQNTIIAEYKGKVAGALTCYDGGQYKVMRDITFPLFSALSDTDFSQMEMETVEGEFYLDSMSVLPEYRNMGIATALLKAGIDRARKLAIGKASLVVLPSNEGAKRLYESLGFEFVQDKHLFGEDYLKYSLTF